MILRYLRVKLLYGWKPFRIGWFKVTLLPRLVVVFVVVEVVIKHI